MRHPLNFLLNTRLPLLPVALALMILAKMNARTFALMSPGEMNALHALGEPTADASGIGCAGTYSVVRVVVTQTAPASFYEKEAEAFRRNSVKSSNSGLQPLACRE